MSYENAVKQKHEIEKKIGEFLKLVASMTDYEIEIAIARMADKLVHELNDTERAHTQIKGEILKEYFDLRKSGEIKQIKYKRIMEFLDLEDKFPPHPKKIEYEKEIKDQDEKWKHKRKCMPFIQRMFTSESLPFFYYPPEPNIPFSELLVHAVAEYRLVNHNSPMPDDLVVTNLLTYAPR